MAWLVLALGSALFLGGYEVARKSAVRDNAVLPVLLVANLGGLAFLVVALFSASLSGASAREWGLDIVSLSPIEHLLVFAKAVMVTSSWVLAYWAVKRLPISIASPLRSLSPVVTIIGALVLFHEAPRAAEWLGMSVLLAGYLGFAWVGRQEGIRFSTNRAVAVLLLGTTIGAFSGLYDKVLLQKFDFPPTTLQLYFSAYNVLLQGALVWLLWWRVAGRPHFRFSPVIPLVGILLVLADQLYFRALANDEALVSIVALVRRSSVVVSFTLGGVLFGESLLRRKAIFLLVLLIGLLLLFV